ncbi:uncharacterized protein [Nicotiana tomentosiformis]|uniref:uncharacterized protein n=1 Tax=Nicotiana tomentosiformis TaxID=4098 RepID=UPI00388C90BE
MRQVSTLCTVGIPTGRTVTFGTIPMAIHEIRDGYSWTVAADSREASPYQKIGEREVVDFLWENLIFRFGILKKNACDNGPQFIGSKVTKFLEDLKIKKITSSTYHLSANWQAESTNKVIIQNLKKRLEAAKGKWPEELSGVLWAYRTTTKSSTGETPFSLVYGAKSLIPVKVGEPTLRYFRTDKEANNEALLVKLELLDEHRDLAHISMWPKNKGWKDNWRVPPTWTVDGTLWTLRERHSSPGDLQKGASSCAPNSRGQGTREERSSSRASVADGGDVAVAGDEGTIGMEGDEDNVVAG